MLNPSQEKMVAAVIASHLSRFEKCLSDLPIIRCSVYPRYSVHKSDGRNVITGALLFYARMCCSYCHLIYL